MKFYKLLALLSVGVAGAFPTACTATYTIIFQAVGTVRIISA